MHYIDNLIGDAAYSLVTAIGNAIFIGKLIYRGQKLSEGEKELYDEIAKNLSNFYQQPINCRLNNSYECGLIVLRSKSLIKIDNKLFNTIVNSDQIDLEVFKPYLERWRECIKSFNQANEILITEVKKWKIGKEQELEKALYQGKEKEIELNRKIYEENDNVKKTIDKVKNEIHSLSHEILHLKYSKDAPLSEDERKAMSNRNFNSAVNYLIFNLPFLTTFASYPLRELSLDKSTQFVLSDHIKEDELCQPHIKAYIMIGSADDKEKSENGEKSEPLNLQVKRIDVFDGKKRTGFRMSRVISITLLNEKQKLVELIKKNQKLTENQPHDTGHFN